jgi:hypothetical protein
MVALSWSFDMTQDRSFGFPALFADSGVGCTATLKGRVKK